MHKQIILPITVLALGIAQSAKADTLTLSVNTSSGEGKVRAAIYANAEAYEKGVILKGKAVAAISGKTKVTFNGLKPGQYGVALFQDINGNEELDRNLLGAPNEPFGFSNNPLIGFSAPKFDAFRFEYDGTPKTLSIKLNGS